MKKRLPSGRTLLLAGFTAVLMGLFAYVMTLAGPLAPVPVTVSAVGNRALTPFLSGVGTVESRYTYRIGPVAPGRLKSLVVHVGEPVRTGQVLGEMDPVDLEERVSAQEAVLRRLEAALKASRARISETAAKKSFAEAQAGRYEHLLRAGAVSVEAAESKRQERLVTAAAWSSSVADSEAAMAEREKARSDLDALLSQRGNLKLVSPGEGIVSSREAEPGTAMAAGQVAVEIVDTKNLWVSIRFDQSASLGLREGLPAELALRSRGGEVLPGRIFRIEPLADPVTEELVAKAVFEGMPHPLPPIGELAEATVILPPLPESPAIPDSALHRLDGKMGVWIPEGRSVSFRPVKTGRRDQDGLVQILEGVLAGEEIVTYSRRTLAPGTRVKVMESVAEAGQ